MNNIETIVVAGTRGPCAGVNMAEQAANEVLDLVAGREKVYTPWGIVHNKIVMERLEQKGLMTIGDGKGKIDWDQAPDGSILFYPAHGTPPVFNQIALERNYHVIDVECPLVTKVHNAAIAAEQLGQHVVYAGVQGHPETEGVRGEIRPENFTLLQTKEDILMLESLKGRLGILLSQTTLATSELKEVYQIVQEKYPNIEIPNRWSICYATDNRQTEAENLLTEFQPNLWIVVGSKNSHNSQMLRRKPEMLGLTIPAYSVDKASELKPEWFTESTKVIGMTSGASVPEDVFWPVPLAIQNANPNVGIVETIPEKREKSGMFRLPEDQIKRLKSRYLN